MDAEPIFLIFQLRSDHFQKSDFFYIFWKIVTIYPLLGDKKIKKKILNEEKFGSASLQLTKSSREN